MLAIRLGPGWEVRAPAKLNLSFDVLARRRDGYHEIESLMVPVGLFDSLYFVSDNPAARSEATAPASVTLDWQWSSAERAAADRLGDVPPEADNLVVRAVELLRRRAGESRGARIRLVKRIPSAAGLGGGSSDAAAALVAANAAWELNWPLDRLADVAAEIGSDVPFFLAGGAAICRGRGERVEPLAGLHGLHFVIVHPPVGLSTARVYGVCRPEHEPGRAERLASALARGDWRRAAPLVRNALQPAAETLTPWIGRLRAEFARLDSPAHQLTGSGSAYFGFCRGAPHARRVASQLRARNLGSVYAVAS